MQKRPQPHGGALNAGGTPGNRGGRPPSVLRDMARTITAEALPKLRLVALGEKVTVTRKLERTGEGGLPLYADVEVRPDLREMMDAFDRLAALGMGEEIRSEDIRARLKHQAEILAAVLPPELLEPVMQAIGEAWS